VQERLPRAQVLDSGGSGSVYDVADGIIWATDNGANIISMSLSGGSHSTLLNAVNYAYNNGVTLVAASGNDYASSVAYPAAYDNVIAVGATKYDTTRASYSNYGSALDIVAPGGDLDYNQNGDDYGDGVLQETFSPTWGYYFFDGTSMATPHVAGTAALLYSNGITNPDSIRDAIQNSAIDLGPTGWDEEYGHGLLNAYNALTYNGNIPPTCTLTANPVSGEAPLNTAFSMSASDSDGTISSWELDAAPSNLFVQHYGVASAQDTSNSFTESYSGTIVNTHEATHNSDNTYHEISENNRIQGGSGKAGLDITYNILISSGTAAPYNLYIESYYSDSGDSYIVSYTVNGGGGESSIITLSPSETTLNYQISGVSAGDTVNVNIKDTSQTPNEAVGTVYIDHLYIESAGSGGGTDDNKLTWDASTDDGAGADDVTNYNVYRSDDGATWSSKGTVTADNSESYSYVDSGAGTADATQWWYMVRAEDSSGLESTDSNSAQEPTTSNNPPTADFTYTTSELTAYFTDASSDSDGSIISWSWDFEDGATSTAQNPTHTYSSAGTYTVYLTVTDDDGATDTTSQSVTVTSGSGITLTATGYKVKGRHHADLEWSGATSTNVDIYRDGVKITTTANDGFYTDSTSNVGGGSYTYQIYDAGTGTWSNEAIVTF